MFPYFSCSSPADKDLLFVDMDIDTKPEDIKFESRATPNGELVYTEDPSKRVSLSNIVLKSLKLVIKSPWSKVSEFSQQDINDGRILFKHKVAQVKSYELIFVGSDWILEQLIYQDIVKLYFFVTLYFFGWRIK